MSLAGSNRKPALTAAARRIAFSRQTADKLKEESWQERAWAVYGNLPEVFYMTRYRSDVASKIEYFVATQDEPGSDPDFDENGAGTKVLEAEGGPSLLRRIVSELIVHWDIPGEAYLTRFDEAPLWRVLSTQELKKHGTRFAWGDESNNLGSIESDQVFRVWDPHPRFHWQADSPTRHVLDNAEELILLTREAKASSMSRVSAGLFVLPDSIDLSPFAEDEDGTPDDVARWLVDVLAKPISDPGSSSSVVPAVMTMHGDDIAKIRHITFARDWEINLELRRELLRSVAAGLDLPPEILTGMADLNHWTAWQVSEQAVSQHVLPSVDAILDSLTINWFRPLLEASGVNPEGYVLWRDPSPATVSPDQSDVAIRMYEQDAISGEALRRVTNFDEEDAPTPEELEDKTARRSASTQGVPSDGPPVQSAIDPDDALRFFELLDRNPRLADLLQQAFVKEGDPPLARAAVTAATRRRIVATELADIDAEILVWVQAQADLEIERLTKLALSAAVDPLDESLLASLANRLEVKIAEAQADARGWLSRTLGRTLSDDGESLARSQGVQVIIAGILEAVRRKLFTPGGAPDPIELGQIGNITTPTQAIRHGLSLAGGGPAVYEDGKAAELIGNGQHVHDELAEDGFFQDGYEWKYGHPANTFEPHMRLDGKQFTSWDDPQLAVNFGDSWLRRSHYAPGDHKGCCCAFIQVIVERLALGEGAGVRPDEMTPLGPKLTWEQFGIKLPTDPARRAMLHEALQRLNGLDPAVRAHFVDLMGRFDGGVKFNVATGSTKSITELGRVSWSERGGRGGEIHNRTLSLQMSRASEEWKDWVGAENAYRHGLTDSLSPSEQRDFYSSNRLNPLLDAWRRDNPEPPRWRLATADEVGDALVHELGHANDLQRSIDTAQRIVPPADIRAKVFDMYSSGPDGQPIAAYKYATSETVEMTAELQKFYLRGVHGEDIHLTAMEWRLANPELASWVEDILLP